MTPTQSKARYALEPFVLSMGGREWKVLNTGFFLSVEEEGEYLETFYGKLPYGVVFWPSSIAMAYELHERAEQLPGKTVLELGTGTGLPGMVAASLGAQVLQTDYHPTALKVAAMSAEINSVDGIEHRVVDWTEWEDTEQYDFIIGSDIIYDGAMHPHLVSIFKKNLAPGGQIILSDPLRVQSLVFLKILDDEGWDVEASACEIAVGEGERSIALFQILPPGAPGIENREPAAGENSAESGPEWKWEEEQ